MHKAPLVEIFASIQGEGRFAGAPMTFLRVAVCPIRCRYCDTPHSYEANPTFPVGLGERRRDERNPVDSARAAALVLEVERGSRCAGPAGSRALSITGGEPLVYPGFVREVGERVRREGIRVHLETAALDPRALDEALPAVDHLSADWKLPETLRSGSFEAEHRACVELAVEAGRSVDVKIVLTPGLAEPSYLRALAALAPFGERILVILQPVTPYGEVTASAPPQTVLRCAQRAAAAGLPFRVLPQVHKALGMP